MTISGKQTNSGRVAFEKNDCTVRAYAEALEIEYLDAYCRLMVEGRRIRKGFSVEQFYDKQGWLKVPKPHMAVNRFIQLIANHGNWIIKIRGHVFAVRSSVIHDINPNANLNCHVECAWMIKG